MKHLLSGVAVAAALVIAAPAWAQAPTTPPAGASTASAPMAPMASTQRHKRMPMHHMAKSSGDAMTDQLNREELGRIQGGGMAPPPPPPRMSGVPGQPSLQKGQPKANTPSPSPPSE